MEEESRKLPDIEATPSHPIPGGAGGGGAFKSLREPRVDTNPPDGQGLAHCLCRAFRTRQQSHQGSDRGGTAARAASSSGENPNSHDTCTPKRPGCWGRPVHPHDRPPLPCRRRAHRSDQECESIIDRSGERGCPPPPPRGGADSPLRIDPQARSFGTGGHRQRDRP